MGHRARGAAAARAQSHPAAAGGERHPARHRRDLGAGHADAAGAPRRRGAAHRDRRQRSGPGAPHAGARAGYRPRQHARAAAATVWRPPGLRAAPRRRPGSEAAHPGAAVMTLSVLVVDDEPLARQRLQRLLRAEPDLRLLPPCADGRAAVAAIVAQRPDLLFLDVQMPGMTGFEVLAAVGPKDMPVVIFVTAHDRFALQAFEAEALDYLLKPFVAERVHKALARARDFLAGGTRRKLEQQYAGLLRATGARDDACVLVKKRERVLVLRPEEIDFVEAYGDY